MNEALARLGGIEAYDGMTWPADLVAELWSVGRQRTGQPFLGASPSFKTQANVEPGGCGAAAGAFPAFSITGNACALQCGHCRGRILEPMIAATTPDALEQHVRAVAARQPVRGFLLSGGSNLRNEVPFERFLPAVKRLKRDMPGLEVAVHTGLVDRRRAGLLAEAGIDVAMLDIIGAQETVREVYNLERPVADFEASLAALVAVGLQVVPHVVVGLHFGRVLGEAAALEIIARHRTRAAILVVLMTHLADERFSAPDATEVARVMMAARAKLSDRQLLLGCARGFGLARRRIDAYAVLAGLDGIAHPSEGVIELARSLGREVVASGACCGVAGCRKAA